MTYGFVASWTAPTGRRRQRLVLRIGPPSGLFAPYRAAPEFTVLRALEGGAVPVPRACFFSDSPEVFGGPFSICEHVAGTAPLPWVAQGRVAFEPVLRARLAGQFVASLAALHRFDWRSSPVAGLAANVSLDNAAALQVT